MVEWLTQAEIAERTGVSPQYVCKVLKRPGAPRASKSVKNKGRYNFERYLYFVRATAAKSASTEEPTDRPRTKAEWDAVLAQRKVSMLDHQIERVQMENARARGELVPRDEVLSLVGRLAQVVVHALEASQADVSARFPGAPEVVDQYDAVVRRVRERLAEEVEGVGG